jgi:hypothetical protein
MLKRKNPYISVRAFPVLAAYWRLVLSEGFNNYTHG